MKVDEVSAQMHRPSTTIGQFQRRIRYEAGLADLLRVTSNTELELARLDSSIADPAPETEVAVTSALSSR